ncbi:5-formyltetrahydrofolate cyclo-ligase [Sinomonas sp. ASV486]|uniref:5-formyltetrahydrofolate cyclo-ligase n=1 Tax=Sinomonas sp. ASV486 TaxID=3051170 RepID=UPI0027DAFD44|nr:5-formyltetrahydrofolate cyclo-ligase [Sinomonas sp. ASV486]MDQ4491161.1 5-formyltetrahydrofolate cyclo-ligase [Sinomonas sp. ASV486]
MDLAELKSALRAQLWESRRSLAASDIASAAAGIADHGLAWIHANVPQSALVTAYLGVGSEPPTLALIEALHGAGYRVLLPICLPERQLGWVEWHPGIDFARSRYAPVQEPVGPLISSEDALRGCDGRPGVAAVLLPATALDTDGRRLGQGGGYYDRFLARVDALGARLPTAAVVYDGEVLTAGAVPADRLDRRVGAAVTPGGLRPLGSVTDDVRSGEIPR